MIFKNGFERCIILFCVFIFPLIAKEEFFETNDLAQILPHVEKDTLVIFDLDNTLVRTKQALGSDEWFSHKVQELIKEGSSPSEANAKTLEAWMEILQRSDLCFMQEIAPVLIKDLQKRKIPLMALTKRDPRMAPRTLEQLYALNVDFSKTSPHSQDLQFPDHADSLYLKGVAFVAFGKGKGALLEEFFKVTQTKPKKIIFIDDKKKYVDEVGESSRELGIDYVGIRYSGADEKVQNFDPTIADMQWEKFSNILSDDEAHLLMKQSELNSSPR